MFILTYVGADEGNAWKHSETVQLGRLFPSRAGLNPAVCFGVMAINPQGWET